MKKILMKPKSNWQRWVKVTCLFGDEAAHTYVLTLSRGMDYTLRLPDPDPEITSDFGYTTISGIAEDYNVVYEIKYSAAPKRLSSISVSSADFATE